MDSDHVVLTHPHDFFEFKKVSVVPSTCFVLIPFADEFDIVYETIEGALKGLMACTRADDIAGSGSILERVLHGIASAELIVADLTGSNANVFYELGIAHSRTKRVLLLTQNINDVPFDLGSWHCKIYSLSSTRNIRDLREAVRLAAEDVVRRRTPSTLEGSLRRTRLIVEHMHDLLANPKACSRLLIRIQGAISSLGNLSADESSSEYESALHEEREALIKLGEHGALIQVVVSPLGIAVADDNLQSKWERRINRVIEFLREGKPAADRCQVVLSTVHGSNLFCFNDDRIYEGHKTGVERGFGLTMVYTDKHVVRARIGIFDSLFESARSFTLRT